MFLKSKKYLVFGVLLLVLIAVVVLKFFFSAKAEPPAPALPPLSLEAPPEAPTGAAYTFTADFSKLPGAIPVYRIINPPTLSLSEIKQIAQNFGFSGEPKINTDIESGDFYSWADKDKDLSIGGNPTKISFGLSSLPNDSTSSAQLSNQEANAIAQKTFREKFPLEKNIDFDNPSFSYFETAGEFINQTLFPSPIVKVSYNYKLNNLPVLGNSPLVLPFSVFLGPKGEMIKLDYLKYPESFQKGEEKKLLSEKQAKTALSLQKGTIVSLLSEQDLNAEIPPNYQIASAQIEKVSLAYYYPLVPVSEKEILIQPVFVFEGTGIDQTSGKTVNLIIYLPATAGP